MPIHMVFMSSMEDAFIGRGNYNGSTGLQVDAFRIDRGGPVVNACRYGGASEEFVLRIGNERCA
jgi:hypothetical protein